VRQALPDYQLPVTPHDLAALALEPDVESRIVLEQGAEHPWQLRLGPFSEQDFAQLPRSHWTLLIQALDLWVPEVADLYQHFAFLPPWRRDDIMASFAAPGGSVGPHFDQYDVFLLQVEGDRRWQIGAPCAPDVAILEGTELDILAQFEPEQEWLLEPGDLLYLPPRVPHWGIAETECMTLSVGFRAPSVADMLAELAVDVATLPGVAEYRDPPLTPAMATVHIDPAFIAQVREQLSSVLADEALLADWFARYMTQAKYPDLEAVTGERRVASVGRRFYENGERREDR